MPNINPDSRPNILWLSLESVRRDHTTVHDYERDTTPEIDKLASAGDTTVLHNGTAASCWTPGVTASMLTGTHMSTHNVGADGRAQKKLPETINTLPELLPVDYRSGLFSSSVYISDRTGLSRGFDHYEHIGFDPMLYLRPSRKTIDYWIPSLKYLMQAGLESSDRIITEAKSAADDVIRRRMTRWMSGTDRPFFAYAHIHAPHHPYTPPKDYLDTFADEIEMDIEDAYALVQDVYADMPTIKHRIAHGLNLTAREWEGITALYDAEIRQLDTIVGGIVDKARAASDRKLVIVLVGDHGEFFGEAGLIGHHLLLHDALLRVPMVVKGIDDVVDNSKTQTQQIDLTRTIAEITGADTTQLQGRDIRHGDRKTAISQRGVAHLSAYTDHNDEFDVRPFFTDPFSAVRTADFKLAMNDNRSELYGLPNETTNMITEYPDIATKLTEQLDAATEDWTQTRDQAPAEYDEKAKQRLNDLGYMT